MIVPVVGTDTSAYGSCSRLGLRCGRIHAQAGIGVILAFTVGVAVVFLGPSAVAGDAGAPGSGSLPDAQPAMAADAIALQLDTAPEARPQATQAQSGSAGDTVAGQTMPPADEQVLSVLASVKDITELSLEDLLNTELITSTKSKPMSIRDSPNVMTLVTREEILRSGARELADVLRLIPGIQLNGDLYSSVYAGFRGIWGSEGKILVLFDGHELFELLYYGTELGNRIPVDQIDRIEIIRGPGSVVYGGSAELAVINIITRSAEDLEGASVTGIYGQMFDGAIHHGQSLADTFARRTVSAMAGRTFGGADGLHLKAGLYVGQGNRSDQPYTDSYGATYNLAGNARTDPMLFHAAADYRGLKVGYLFEYYRTTMKDGYSELLADTLPVNYLSSSLNVSYLWKLGQGLTLVPRFHWLYQKPWQTATETALQKYPDYFYWDPTAQRILGGLTLAWDATRWLNLLAGTEYYVDSATNTFDPFVDPDNPAQTVSHVSYQDATVYGQALVETPWANLSAGARYEHRSHVGGAFVPRAGATKTFGRFHYKVLYSRAFRAPAISNLSPTIDVKSETTTVAEIEMGYRLHAALFAVLNVFDITIDRPFAYFATTDTEGYRNYDRMGTRGAEFELRFKSDRHFADLSYSYYTAAGKDRIDTLAVPGHGSVLLGFSPHKVALLAGTGITQHVDASLSAILLAGQRFGYYAYDAAGAPVAKDYGAELQVNAFVSYQDLLFPGSFVGLGIYNLANAKTVLIQPYDNGHSPMPGPTREVFLRIGYDHRRR
jgi:outer membrane cobalamin receptor